MKSKRPTTYDLRSTRKVLIIAGFDPSGNAGVIRDLEIIRSFGIKASCVITALTAQNKKKFISSQVVPSVVFRTQLQAVLPLSQYQAIKIGMLGNEKIIRVLISVLKKEKKRPPIILDPVYESSTGGVLLTKKGRDLLWKGLIPLVDLWTPNLMEASYYYGKPIQSLPMLMEAGRNLYHLKKVPVYIKGGIFSKKIYDLFVDRKIEKCMAYSILQRGGLRGTGCALSSFVAVLKTHNQPLLLVVVQARRYMQRWINEAK